MKVLRHGFGEVVAWLTGGDFIRWGFDSSASFWFFLLGCLFL
jgi:hypothetical protein